MNASAVESASPPLEPANPPQAGSSQQSSASAADEEPIALGDRAMLYLLVFFFGMLGVVLLLDMVSGLWRR